MKKRGKVRIGQQLWACRDEGGIESLQLIFPRNSSKRPSTVGYDTYTPLSYETFEIQQFENFLLNFSSCQGSSKKSQGRRKSFFLFCWRMIKNDTKSSKFCWLCNKLKKKFIQLKKVCCLWDLNQRPLKWNKMEIRNFQMQFSLIILIAMHTPPIQNEISYCNLFQKASPKYLLVSALCKIFIWKKPFCYINFAENDFCVGTHWLQTPILNSFWARNLQIFKF